MPNPYHDQAEQFFAQYHSVRFDDVHDDWLHHLPARHSVVLDIGAGSGRDAKALAERGWQVLAVEPAENLRLMGQGITQGLDVTWVDDKLPELSRIRTLSGQYQLILVSAVWMHLRPTEQSRALRVLATLLAPGGILVITFREGESGDERRFHPVHAQALEGWARDLALIPLQNGQSEDRLQRPGMTWHLQVFRLPDDGTGTLPVLRHIIVNDNKSSTYKLGLLRAITRLADTAPGLVLSRDEDHVILPLGAVGLIWILLYRPLILDRPLRQSPSQGGYSFDKADFRALAGVAPGDLRIGRPLEDPGLAATVLRAIREACRTILKMPVIYTTWPGSSRPIFDGQLGGLRIREAPARLDQPTLARFGVLRVPTALWDCMSRHACWLEPTILHEWVQLMQGYAAQDNIGVLHQALQWPQSRRDTAQVRQRVARRIQDQQPTHCVWTRRTLRVDDYAIDHCFPWARWQNNDLWNLMPANKRANDAKSDRLPAAPLMQQSRQGILAWWYTLVDDPTLARQFQDEAHASLPLLPEGHSLDELFESVLIQRQRLRANQQIAEWFGLMMT